MRRLIQQRRRYLSLAAVLTILLLALAVPAGAAWAGHNVCRSDPEVTLSDGQVVVITADIDVDAMYVQNVVYTLHAPPGTSVVSVIYFGDVPAQREQLVFIADASAHHYKTRTVVQTVSNAINVTTYTMVGAYSRSRSGHTNQNLDVDIDAH